jgi:hypothetical protein
MSKSASQREADEFHMMLGYCIVAWAEVDECLFRIFRDCVGPYEQCAIIFYKTPGLEARFSLTDEIVKSIFPKEPNKPNHPSVVAWSKAIKGHQDLLATRRRLAHHPTTVRMDALAKGRFNTAMFGHMPIGGSATAFSWVESQMSHHERLRGKAGANLPPLRFKDLEDHYGAVGALANRLLTYLIDILTKPTEEPSRPNTKHR